MNKIFASLCVLLFLFGCKKNTHQLETNEVLKELKYNNQEPWIVNNETHIGVLKMDSIIKEFSKSKNDNYTVLGESLSKQTSYIIKSCDMKGEAHDQLHVVLVPMLDEISILRENIDISNKKNALIRLEIYIKKYFKYFTK